MGVVSPVRNVLLNHDLTIAASVPSYKVPLKPLANRLARPQCLGTERVKGFQFMTANTFASLTAI